jgi:hypothetical protein
MEGFEPSTWLIVSKLLYPLSYMVLVELAG